MLSLLALMPDVINVSWVDVRDLRSLRTADMLRMSKSNNLKFKVLENLKKNNNVIQMIIVRE